MSHEVALEVEAVVKALNAGAKIAMATRGQVPLELGLGRARAHSGAWSKFPNPLPAYHPGADPSP